MEQDQIGFYYQKQDMDQQEKQQLKQLNAGTQCYNCRKKFNAQDKIYIEKPENQNQLEEYCQKCLEKTKVIKEL